MLVLDNSNYDKRIEFNCNKQNISEIHKDAVVGKKTMIVQMNLNDNLLSNIAFKFTSQCINLELLELANNKLSYIDDKSFSNNIKLSYIDIQQNKLTDINEDAFTYNLHLNEIYFNNNSLTQLRNGLFKKNIKLRKIACHDNRITTISGSWLHLVNLRELVIYNNKLSLFREEIFKLNIPLLYVHNNTFICRHDLKWILKYTFNLSNYEKSNYIGKCKNTYQGININIYDFLDKDSVFHSKAMEYLGTLSKYY